jgi:hypothetical protein
MGFTRCGKTLQELDSATLCNSARPGYRGTIWVGVACRKCKKITVGFTGCGKTHPELDFEGFVTGHDFSRADKAKQINVGLQPLQRPILELPSSKAFFRSPVQPHARGKDILLKTERGPAASTLTAAAH